MTREMFYCICGATGILITKWDDGEVSLSMWEHRAGMDNLFWRLRSAYRIIRYGYADEDSVLLSPEDVVKLGQTLLRAYPETQGTK